MTIRFLVLILCYPLYVTADKIELHGKDWSATFEKFSAQGTIVIYDERHQDDIYYVHNKERAVKRFSPASTFKIAHSLFALDAGLIESKDQVYPWDEKNRPVNNWNQDQTLESAMKYSTVWVFENFAKELGDAKELEYLKKLAYGNQKTGKSPFWIAGDLAISAVEQVQFLRSLYHETLPFKKEHQALIKSVMTLPTEENLTLRGKTGWDGKVGWIVGWAETKQGAVFFALNIDTPRKMKDLPARADILAEVLKELIL